MKWMNSKLTIEILNHALDFDPATGIFLWSHPQSNAVKVGDRAGVVASNGRRYINIAGEKHMAHRLAWFYIYGDWPQDDVKQPNGNYDDCRKENLVLQSRQQTATNRRVNASSKSGHAGITWSEKRQRWQVHITRDYKQVGLGYFGDLDEAIEVRKAALAEETSAISPEDREKAAHNISRRRRQRVAWKRLVASEMSLGWPSLDDFCRDVGDIPETKMAIVAIDASQPIGPGNFRWSLPPEIKHDFQTREGRIAYNKAHRSANFDIYKDRDLRRKFNISLDEYNVKLASQDGVCAICQRPERASRDGEVLGLAVDHDHQKDKKDKNGHRDLLCGNCNKGLGKFEDNPEYLLAAIAYIRKHAAPAPFVCDDPTRDWLHVATPGHPMVDLSFGA